MIRWIPYTFVRISFFFIAGILLAIFFPGDVPLWLAWTILISSVVAYALLFILRMKRNIPFVLFGIPAFIAIFSGGYLRLHNQTDSNDPNHFGSANDIQQYIITITGYPEEKDKSWKVIGDVSLVKTNNLWKRKHGKVLLYFRKSDFSKPFSYGDELAINGNMQLVPEPGNPGEFDYKKFLSYRNIYHQHFIRRNDAMFIRNTTPNLLIAGAIQTRNWANNILYQYVSGTREAGIASALVLGVTDGLDNDLLTAYASTGAMHVLAVSGLHITIIYLIILWVLKPFSKLKHSKWITASISLFILWGYAFVTGLSPSVLRAVTMFTFICVAKATSRNTNIYNTLAASAFCILIYDPYLIMSVGFQLSYLAVLGIVYLHPLIYAWWEPRGWLSEKIWSVICVSIAAQLATFPLSILYFHQFPNYFLLSNLLVIPLSFGVLVLGLFLLAVGSLNFVASVLGVLLTWCIQLMNLSVELVKLLPFSLVENISISPLQSFVLMSGCLFIILAMQFKQYRFFLTGFFFMISFSVLQWSYHFENADRSKICVYKVSGHTAIDFIDGESAYFFSDSSLQGNDQKIRYHIKPNRLLSHIDRIYDTQQAECFQPIPGGKLILWKGEQILYISEKNFQWHDDLTPAVVVIAKNAVTDFTMLNLNRKTKIIFDSSNSFYYVRKMLDNHPSLKAQTYSVVDDGSCEFSTDLNS